MRSGGRLLVVALVLAAALAYVLSSAGDRDSAVSRGEPDGDRRRGAADPLVEGAGRATRDEVRPDDTDLRRAIHGRCYDPITRAGVADVFLALVGPSTWITTTSRADGTFAFDGLEWREDVERIHPLAPPGWYVAEVSLHVMDDQRDGTRAIEIPVSVARTDRIRGAILDARTDEPVPRLELHLNLPNKRHETARTDEFGRFETLGAYALTEAAAWVAESPGDAVRWRLLVPADEEGDVREEARLTVPIGPTMRVALEAPPAVDDSALWCRIVESSDRGERRWSVVALRAGEPRWLRYARVEHEPDPAWRAHLDVRDRDGLWRGRADLTTTVGVHATTLPVRLALVGAAAKGRVLDDRGEPVAHVRLAVQPLERARPRALETRSGEDGGYDVRELETGRHRFTFRTGLHAAQTIEHELLPGQNALPDVVFPHVGELGSIEGVVRVVGEEPPAGHLVLRALDGPPIVEFEPLGLNYDHERDLFPFAFGRLPPGRYELTVRTSVGHAFDPVRQVVTAPTSGVEIGARTDLPGSMLSFEPFDASTGDPVHAFEVTSGRGDHWPLDLASVGHGFAWAWRTADGEALEWVLVADGYRAVRGTRADFDADGVARPRLRPGFGTVLFLKDAGWLAGFAPGERNEPLLVAEAPGVAGVGARVGERVVATSDARGLVVLALDEEPARVELVSDHWQPLPTGDWNGGRLRATDALLIELVEKSD